MFCTRTPQKITIMVGKILPKKLAKGVDFCGVGKYYYIVRSDLTCYMRSTNFNRAEDLEVFSLHPSCRDGDHYLAHKDDLFYIIKGNNYRRVTNMNKDEDSVVYTLHPNCQGGDHYLSAFDYFYIIYQNRGVYRRTKNMNKDEESEEFPLHPNCKDGLYYFGTSDYYYFVKPHDEWGIQYLRSTNFNKNENSEIFSFHPSVINFLPGGLAITKGPSYGTWVCIKTISNDSQTPVEWKKRVTKKTGYEKEKMCSIEHKWNTSLTVSTETGGLSSCIAKATFAMTAEYGGSSVNTERENWSEATEIEETITVTLKANEKIYIWTYELGLGKEPVLHCRDMRILNTSNPPTDNPLPPAAN
ncbi:uncharacterized protein LOC130284931 isoform X2 [Hyla sarda]|uniref:uncharacterized protein LOC130284931 isoform X2 n=1 Tax=Hyla sarda TaxID=327740 RepID=UPI0024C3C359|nr:uncharacterized protein LOC130284931 isoform X2 [Hyla sarda]